MTAIRIVLVDDQPLIRHGFSAILETEPGFEVVGEASNGSEAVELVTELAPDVVCMDVQMPVMDGIAATREIQAAAIPTSVLILTTRSEEHTSELPSRGQLVCRLLLEKKNSQI